MRAIKSLSDVQIVLKEILDWKDTQLSKAKDQRGHQIKNAGDATEPTDLVTLRQLESAFPPGSKVKGTTIVTQTTSSSDPNSGGSVGPAGPPGPPGPPGTSAAANAVTEIPSGTMNGSNTIFTLSYVPVSGSLILQLNGVTQGIPEDVIVVGSQITYLVAPKSTDWQKANYFR